MYTLFGFTRSGSAAVEIALERCGVPYRIVRAATWEPDSALAELEKVNPQKQIPTLVAPGGEVLVESAAILVHLGLEHPASGLLPTDPMRRARAIGGLVFIATNCYSAIGVIDFPERWFLAPDEATNARLKAGAIARLHRQWELFADLFGGEMSPEAPGALDVLAAVVSRWAGTRAHLAGARPELLRAIEGAEAHPWVAPTYRRHWT